MKLTQWDPLRDMDDLIDRYAPLFRGIPPGWARGFDQAREWSPAADLADTAGIKADAENGSLTIHIPRRKGAKATEVNIPIR